MLLSAETHVEQYADDWDSRQAAEVMVQLGQMSLLLSTKWSRRWRILKRLKVRLIN